MSFKDFFAFRLFQYKIDFGCHFGTNLVPFCFPKSNQNPRKCRPQEAPNNASIFDSVLDPKNLPLGTQLGTILALSLVFRRPKRPPRPSQEASKIQLGAILALKFASRRPKKLPAPLQKAFQSPQEIIFGGFLIDFRSIVDQQTTSFCYCYIVILLLCYVAPLLLFCWRGGGVAALLRCCWPLMTGTS